MVVLVKRVKRICSPLKECFYKAGRELFQKEKFLSYRIYSSSLNCYSIDQCNTKEKNVLPSPKFLLNFPQKQNLGRNGRNLEENYKILLCRPLQYRKSETIRHCHWSSQTNTDCHIPYQAVTGRNRALQTVTYHYRLSQTIRDCHKSSQCITDCHITSQTITGRHRVIQTVTYHYRLSQIIRDCPGCQNASQTVP